MPTARTTLRPRAQKAYDEALAPAQKAYDEAVVPRPTRQNYRDPVPTVSPD